MEKRNQQNVLDAGFNGGFVFLLFGSFFPFTLGSNDTVR